MLGEIGSLRLRFVEVYVEVPQHVALRIRLLPFLWGELMACGIATGSVPLVQSPYAFHGDDAEAIRIYGMRVTASTEGPDIIVQGEHGRMGVTFG